MPKTIDEITKSFAPERIKRIEEGAARDIAEYKSLQKIRQELGITQVELASKLEVSQNNVSTLEKRTDIKLSTLKSYLEALGGELVISAKFPDQPLKVIESLS